MNKKGSGVSCFPPTLRVQRYYFQTDSQNVCNFFYAGVPPTHEMYYPIYYSRSIKIKLLYLCCTDCCLTLTGVILLENMCKFVFRKDVWN